MKYYLIAGEASGDLHGSNLVKALHQFDPEAAIRAWGGDLMQEAGAEVVKHYRDLAFMGFLEVVKNLPTILANFSFCKQDILSLQPDALILIDYPGFNLRMAKWAKKKGIRVFYYISPQLWAWHTSRVKIIRNCVDRMYVILPFETTFYHQHGVEVDYPGHPLLDVLTDWQTAENFHIRNGIPDRKPIVALLPGSRKQEITRMLDSMLSVLPHFPDYQFVVAGAPGMESTFYEPWVAGKEQVSLVMNQTYDLLTNSRAALVTSGTATLETALLDVPQVVCYSGNPLSYALAKRLVSKDLQYIAMVNLIAGKKVVTELIQDELTTNNLKNELKKVLNGTARQQVLDDYREIRKALGGKGASERTAKWMVERLKI